MLAALPAAAAEPLTSTSPFRREAPATAPSIEPAQPRFQDRHRTEVPPVSERIRRRGFERRQREGETSFGDQLLEHRRRER